MKFFHRITKANFRRNFIHFLINKDGKEIQDKYQSMKMCWSYFNNIFNDQEESSGPMMKTYLTPIFSQEDNDKIMGVPSEEEN